MSTVFAPREAQQGNELDALGMTPLPRSVRIEPGSCALTRDTVVVAPAGLTVEAEYLIARIGNALGRRLTRRSTAAGAASIELRLSSQSSRLGAEGYRLDVSESGVVIAAATNAGVFYGIQTLLQLCPTSIFGDAEIYGGVEIPCLHIEDAPRFSWRGAMLDVARWFMPVEFILKFIDALASHKMNVLHLHLTDDQGWRMEIKRYPRLTSVGASRKASLVGHLVRDPFDKAFQVEACRFDGKPHGGFYTQRELRRIVEYAAARHITVVPEIDMPGHAQAAVAAYPTLGCTNKRVEVSGHWGIHPYLYNVSEQTFRFLQDVLTEVMDVFPSPYIHIGGDEAVKNQWQENALCQDRIRELGLRNEQELQSYFIGRMSKFLQSHGRRLIGWDEIIEGGLAENAVVMSWRGEEGGVEAARAGHDVVMAPYQVTYFDYYQSADRSNEPLAFPGEYTPLSQVYNYDPIPSSLPLEHTQHVLGSQGQLWSEYMPTTSQVEYMAFPRMTALAEVLWSYPHSRNFPGFVDRLKTHAARLEHMRINFRPLTILE